VYKVVTGWNSKEIAGHKLRIYQYCAEIFFPSGHLLQRNEKEKIILKRNIRD